MTVKRLRWAASPDRDVTHYRVYRWYGERPYRPQRIAEVPAHHERISVRVPLTRLSAVRFRLPLPPAVGESVTVLVDGVPAEAEIAQEEVVLKTPVSEGHLVEGSYVIYGMELIDADESDTGSGVSVQLFNSTVTHLTPDSAGWIEITWQPLFGAMLPLHYEVAAVTASGVESETNPTFTIPGGLATHLDLLIEQAQDGETFAPVATVDGFAASYVMRGVTKLPYQLPDADAHVTVEEETGTAVLSATWNTVPQGRTVLTDTLRLTPLLGTQQVGPAVTLAPIPLSLTTTGIRVRMRKGESDAVPSFDGPDGETLADLPPDATSYSFQCFESYQTYTLAFYIVEDSGLYAAPLVVRATFQDLSPDAPVLLTVEQVDVF